MAGAKVEFKCEAVTDEQEAANLTIEWKKDGEYIAYAAERRMAKNTVDNSLIISNVQTEDTATYTCVASNKLDEATREESIIVQGRSKTIIIIIIMMIITIMLIMIMIILIIIIIIVIMIIIIIK